MPRYRHTQFGWAVVTSLLLPIGVLGVVAMVAPTPIPFLTLIPLILALACFAWLTVVVTNEVVDLRFGIGVIRRCVRLDDIVSIAPVSNPWLSGWGIRFIPGGRLYNVSGTSAVELVLRDGRRVRIGTDDQDGLITALREARATVLPSTVDAGPMIGYTMAGPAIVVAMSLAAMALVLMLSSRPIEVISSDSEVSIRGAGYSAQIPASDIVSVHLDDRLPDISWRTNGASFRGRLRGHFKLADGRAAQLFVTRSHPPFIMIETRTEPVILNFDEPERTKTLFARLSASIR